MNICARLKGGNQVNFCTKNGHYKYIRTEKNGEIILLLIGGDKSTQQKDIEKAKEIWKKIKK